MELNRPYKVEGRKGPQCFSIRVEENTRLTENSMEEIDDYYSRVGWRSCATVKALVAN